MRKPLTPIAVEEPNQSTLPTALRFGVRSKRTTTTLDVPNRAKRARALSLHKQCLDQPTYIDCNEKDGADALINCTGNGSNKNHRSCLPPQLGKMKQNQSDQCNGGLSCVICGKGFLDGAKQLFNSVGDIRVHNEKRFCCVSCQNREKASPTKNSTTVPSRVGKSLPTVAEAVDLETSEVDEFLGFNKSDVPPLPRRRSKSVDCSVSIQNEPNSANTDRNNIPRTANENIIDTNDIPDASAWTLNQVYKYFMKIFPRHAHVFEDEEIDGQDLYQLKREDVVGRFKLRIGPSLKIYAHILKMQKKRENRL
ncbi:polyhomeotic-like protein 2 isoform X2 [Bradysia coprophila]|uniref:polyhomeotic-like protein 2 isoform X2 n=1 Tax=Bradysia coprophila TaxID=38358 RepID=UPI00187D937D|nr:polyhomeotic-like protein 2 isoform X2 [Bradysia coprophila]